MPQSLPDIQTSPKVLRPQTALTPYRRVLLEN